ncbi:MAG: hypothetical protein AAB071_04925 [Bacteroidota bacterium]
MSLTAMQVNNSSEKNFRCIWMDAGVISYKLCTRNFVCDECPLDKEILGNTTEKKTLHKKDVKTHTEQKKNLSANDTHLTALFDEFFLPPQCVSFSANRYYCKNHLWLEQLWENFYNIGIDDIGVYYLQHINAVSLPEKVQHFQEHSPLFSLLHNEGTVTLASPCSGNIISYNNFLCERPILFHSISNNQWVLCVYLEEPEKLTETTMTSVMANNFYAQQIEQLRTDFLTLITQSSARNGPTLHDGGKLIHNLINIIGSKKYYEMITSLFIL